LLLQPLKATAVEQFSTVFGYLLIVVNLNQQRKQDLISFTPVAPALACQMSKLPPCVAAEQTSFLSRPATAAMKQELSPSQVPRLELLSKVIFSSLFIFYYNPLSGVSIAVALPTMLTELITSLGMGLPPFTSQQSPFAY
jgi:hypothetical protein